MKLGKRKCAMCGASFAPAGRRSRAITCGSECSKERRKQTQREHHRNSPYYPAYRKKNREKIRRRNKEWKLANPEKVREQTARYREKYPRERKERFAKWYAENRESVLERKRANAKTPHGQHVRRASAKRNKEWRISYNKEYWRKLKAKLALLESILGKEQINELLREHL